MVVVPENVTFLAEVIVLNKDIGQIQINQSVELKVNAFDFTRFGSLQGTIKSLSQDAIEMDQGLLGYCALIDIDSKTNPNVFEQLNAGMSLMTEIDTGQRRVIEFFLFKLIKYQDESLSER